MEYMLLDLERTIKNGVPAYWKGNKHGYTYNLEFAGIFREEIAKEIVKHDMDGATVAVPMKLINDILLGMKPYEGKG